MRCTYCQGTMSRGTAPMHVDRKGYHLSLDAVPAWVCAQCGEPYFEGRDVESIQRMLIQLDEQTGQFVDSPTNPPHAPAPVA